MQSWFAVLFSYLLYNTMDAGLCLSRLFSALSLGSNISTMGYAQVVNLLFK